jgi:hypothetical protein
MMSDQSTESGFQKRVYTGHLGNFMRKLKSVETADDLERVMQTIRLASEKGMIEPSQLQVLSGEYDLQRNALIAGTSQPSIGKK